MASYDILVAGGVGIDTTVRVGALPLPLADSIQVPPVRDYVAHTGNGVALGCHALGLKAKFIDFIGDDPQGAMILERYRRTGLDFTHLVHPSGTRRSVNLVDADGRRLSLYDGRHPDSLRMPREIYLPLMQQARHTHFSIMNWTRALFDDATALGIKVSTDLHDWDGANKYHQEFALRADLVFVSTSALGERRDAVMRDILRNGRAEIVVAMAGGAGSYVLARNEDRVRHFPIADLQRPIVDTNGAGDAFVCGFLSAYFAGLPVEECMARGAVSGAYACGCVGTHEEFISAEQLARYREDK